eukprot:gene527-563_t
MNKLGLSDADSARVNLNNAIDALKNSSCYEKISDLKTNFDGKILLPSDPDPSLYEAIRGSVFNKLYRGYPLVIAQVKTIKDVVKILDFKSKCGDNVVFTIASGKHSNFVIPNKAIVLDVSLLDEICIDEQNLAVTVGGGTTTGKLDEELAKHGFVTVGAVKPEVSVAGWAINGGYGTLSRLYGYGADQILEAEVVLASGEIVTATNENEFADLLSGIRGAGPNFGVITKLKLRIYKAPPVMLGGLVVYLTPTSASKSATLIEFDRLVQNAPEESFLTFNLVHGLPVCPLLVNHVGEEGKTTVENYPFLVQATNLGSWMRVSNTIQSADYVTVHQKQLVKIQIPNFNIFSEFYAGNIEEPLPPSFLSALGDFVHNHVPAKVTSAGVAFVLLGGGMARGIANASTSISVTSRSARYYVAVTATVKSEASEEAIAAGRKWVSDVTAMFTPYMKRLER